MRGLIALCLAGAISIAASACGPSRSLPPRDEEGLALVPGSGPWRARNLPLLKEYLATLPADSLGQPIKGIPLSDGSRWLEGYVYRGRPAAAAGPGVNAVLLEAEDELRLYLWLDEDAAAFDLPVCTGGDEGVRARDLTEQVFTWRSLRPEHGIVYSPCPPLASQPGAASEPER